MTRRRAPRRSLASAQTIQQIIRRAFPNDQTRALCIARYESTGGWGYRPRAINGSNTGLFQIDRRTWDWTQRTGAGRAAAIAVVGRVDWSRMLDPAYNARVARRIYDYSHGWGPWSTRGECGG